MRVGTSLSWLVILGFALAPACGGEEFEPGHSPGDGGPAGTGASGGTGASSGVGASSGTGASSGAGGSGGTGQDGGGTGGTGQGGAGTGGTTADGGGTGGDAGTGGQCDPGLVLCGVDCTDTTKDINHCGSCSIVCPVTANAKPLCQNGTCNFSCFLPYGDCDGNASNGCEADKDSDPKNCGGCKVECPLAAYATATCTKKVCSFQCTAPFGNCDANDTNGCETDTTQDKKHCGGCNKPCELAPDGATALVCKSSTCSCDGALSKCTAGSGTVACVDTTLDPRFCGGCSACPDGQGCKVGQCFTPACAYGQTYCTSDSKCHNLQSDWSNCGACGKQCDYAQNCVKGACVDKSVFCSSYGLQECPDICVDFARDSANCGTCGTKCPAGHACTGNQGCKPLPLAGEPWECVLIGKVPCLLPASWPEKPAPYYCWTSCVL